MASENQEEKKPDDGVPDKEEGQGKVEEKEKSRVGAEEEKPSDASVKEGSQEEEEEEEQEDEKENKEEAEEIDEVKGNRKRISKKGVGESKEPREYSTEKKKRRRKGSGSQEPVTPIDRPVRERKTVERYSASSSEKASAPKVLSIEKGHGTQLRDIPNVAFKLSKKKPDENLQLLHTILFGKRTKTHNLKKNIGQFSGFVWVENEERQRAKVKEKLDKCFKEKLLDFCDVLDISVSKASVKKEELTAKLLEFLESPYATTEVLLADKEKKGKQRKRKTMQSTEKTSARGSTEILAKKQKQTLDVRKKQKHSAKSDEEVEPAGTKDDSDGGDDDRKEESDLGLSESEEENELKEKVASEKDSARKNAKKGSEAKGRDTSTPAKKGTLTKSMKSTSSSDLKKGAVDDIVSGSPSKSKGSTTKRKKRDSESEQSQSASARQKPTSKKQPGKSGAKASTKEKGKGKASVKVKAEPSREDLHAAVVDILKEVDFNTATLSDILRQLGMHFSVDLMHRKAEVKSIITDVINSMTDEEDEAENDDGEAEEDMDEKVEKDDDDGDS